MKLRTFNNRILLMVAALAILVAVSLALIKAGPFDAEAQFNLAVKYATGDGVPKNDAEAVKWYRKAAEQGEVTAQSNLGAMYHNGDGVPKNDAEAAKWYRKAALQLDALFSDRYEEDKDKFKASFVKEAAEQEVVGEFLYVQGGTTGGTWNWGKVGSVNGALLWPDAFAYLCGELTRVL